MGQLTIAVIGANQESCRQLKIAIQATAAGAEIITSSLPLTGAVCAELGRIAPAIILVEVSPADPKIALDTMSAIRDLLPKAKIAAIGEVKDSNTLVGAMRAGACDFLEAPPQMSDLARLISGGSNGKRNRAKIFSFVNAKGGSGSTTLAVNLSLVLATISRRVALIDLAIPGNAALHLDLKTSFTVAETCRNLHRLDALLLDGMIAKHESGLHLLAGAHDPEVPISGEQLASLLDVVTAQYEFVVVDLSTRLDGLTRSMCDFSDEVMLVGQPDVASMWNAQRVHRYLGQNISCDKFKLVLNRHRKTPGVSDSEFEKASGCKLVWTVPNHYMAIANSITKGNPIAQQSSTELKESFVKFAFILAGAPEEVQTVLLHARGGKTLLERVVNLRSFGSVGAKASA